MSSTHPQPASRPRLRLLAGAAFALSLITLALAAPAGAAPAMPQRDTCLPLPGLPCLPDLPVPGAPTATTPAAITGTPKVDEILTAVEPEWDNPLTLTTYQWQRDGVAIADATDDTYPVVADDVDAMITVAATGTVALLFSTVSTSEPVLGLLGDAPVATTAPKISGATRIGSTLTTDPGTWEGSPEPTFTYQWYRSQGAKRVLKVAGADEPTYDVSSSDAGARLAVVVTATRPGHEPATAVAATGKVDKLDSAINLSTGKLSIPKKKRAVVTVTLTSPDGSHPGGKVVIREGKKKVGAGKASSTNGRAVVKLKRLQPGTHRLIATYRGSGGYASATSKPLTITVKS